MQVPDSVHASITTEFTTEKQPLIHKLFEEVVEQHPDAVATIWGTEALTYAELNRKANTIAHMLLGINVLRGACVGLYLERSADSVIAMLAILKVGGAYVPLDP